MKTREASAAFKRYWRFKGITDIDFLTASYGCGRFGCHFHHGFTLSAVESGVLPLTVRDLNIDVKPGEILVLGPDVPHGFDDGRAYGECRYRTLTRPMQSLTPEMQRELELERNSVCSIRNRSLWRFFIETANSAESGEQKEASRLRELCKYLMYRIGRETLFKFDVKSPQIRATRRYLDENYRRTPGIPELSSAAGLSPRHLTRLFKEELGLTPHSYVNQLRVNEAKAMLGQSVPASAIAQELGFSDQSHFTKTFKKLTGVSPMRYLR